MPPRPMRKIFISGEKGKGKFALVDSEDHMQLKQHSWSIHSKGYAQAVIDYQHIYMHRFVMNAQKGQQLDHINQNKLDNRKENLRFADYATNTMNRYKRRGKYSSIYKGVYKKPRNQGWAAQITHNKTMMYLGHYDTELEAAKVYNAKALELHGEFACINQL